MNIAGKLVVLIVDDEKEYREELLPNEFFNIGATVVTASDVDSALRLIASRFGPSASEHLDLMVLDMHMPLAEYGASVDEEAGVKLLNKLFSLHEYKLVECPVIVFTAYASFTNCVRAIKAGAADYIAKTATEDPCEGGLNGLMSSCRRLLFPGPPRTRLETVPTADWLRLHGSWLRENFKEKWVAFIGEHIARSAGLADVAQYPVLDGIVILSGATYDEVRAAIANQPTLLEQLPTVVQVLPQ